MRCRFPSLLPMKTHVAALFVGLLLLGLPSAVLHGWSKIASSNPDEKAILPQQQSDASPGVPEGDACQDSWSLVASLNWAVNADWDLHLQTPSAHIYYQNRIADGFTLDRDAYPQCSPSPVAPEGITGRGKCGTYKVYSNLYSTCGGSPPITFAATVTVLRPIKINGTAYTPGQTFIAHDNVAFVVTSGCVTSLGVTRLSQGDPRWGGEIYDHTTQHISSLGCALTSLTMAMNFGGLSNFTPGSLNNDAIALAHAYDSEGNVNWDLIPSIGNRTFATTRINSATASQAANNYLDHVLCELGRPVVVGVFNNPSTGAACSGVCHFVLVTGKQTDGKYTIADPGNGSHTTLDAYGNRFETRGYIPSAALRPSPDVPAASITERLSVSASGRVTLLVVDPAGNRTGIDPVSGSRTEGIPNSTHFMDSLTDDVTGDLSNDVSHSVYVGEPSPGRYEIRLTVSQGGPFRISATTFFASGAHATPLFIDGVGVQGQTLVYYVTVGDLSSLGNISTRAVVGTADNALIGGFIITGVQPKTVIVRGIGPSVPLPGALADPTIEVHGSSGELLATNDNWNDATTRQQIIDSGLAPTNSLESALWGILNPGAYTVVLRGTNNATGVGLFEVYDLDRTVNSKLANISTRGFVNTGDNAMIGGTIIIGSIPTNVLVRAIGPSLTSFGVPNALADPVLELHGPSGFVTITNNNWRDTQEAQIIATGIPPSNNLESAIFANLPPGAYTAIVRGTGNSTGVALVEAYQLQ